MQGVDELALKDTGYTFQPTGTEVSDLTDVATAAINQEVDEQHVYDVVSSDGTVVLSVEWGIEMSKEGEGLIQRGSVDRWYAFETPDGERILTLRYEDEGWTSGDEYTLRDASTDSVLAEWNQTAVFGTEWELDDARGETAAVVTPAAESSGLLGTLGLSSNHTSYAVSAPDGREVASIRIHKHDRLSTDQREIDVTLTERLVPAEILLALALGLRRELKQSSSFGGGDGD